MAAALREQLKAHIGDMVATVSHSTRMLLLGCGVSVAEQVVLRFGFGALGYRVCWTNIRSISCRSYTRAKTRQASSQSWSIFSAMKPRSSSADSNCCCKCAVCMLLLSCDPIGLLLCVIWRWFCIVFLCRDMPVVDFDGVAVAIHQLKGSTGR
jgi:hypothetical protein